MNVKESLKKIPGTLKRVGKIGIILIALVAGFASGEIYHRYKDKVKSSEMQIAKGTDQISIAINECGEILFIDRESGQYELYTDSVGRMFFDLYSSKMLYEANKPTK